MDGGLVADIAEFLAHKLTGEIAVELGMPVLAVGLYEIA